MIITDKDRGDQYIRPSYMFDEEKIKAEYGSVDNWYYRNARWVASFYNQNTSSFTGNRSSNSSSPNTFSDRWANSPVAQIMENYRYLFGEQENFNFAYLMQDEHGGQVPAPFIKGKKLQNLILFMQGNIRKLLAASKLSVESLNPSRVSKKMEELALLELKRDFKDMFDQIERDFGIGFRPEGMQQGDMDEIIDMHSRTPVDKMEGYGLDILNDISNKNNLREKMIKAYTDAVIGRYCGILNTERGGRVHIQVIPPYNMIIDQSKDDDYNMEAEFVGYIEYLSPEEIRQKWVLDQDERNKITQIANEFDRAGSLINGYNTASTSLGFEWISTNPGRRHVACVTTYWLAEHEYEQDGDHKLVTKDDDGNKEITYLRIHRSTIIGNCVMKNFGPDDNVVYHPNLTYLPMFPLRVFIPNMFGGTNKSPVDLMRDNQDMIDAYKFKIREAISKDLGKTYIFNGRMMKDLPQEIFSNLKSMGIHVSTGGDGDDEDRLSNRPMAEIIDMTLNKDVLAYLQLIAGENDEMQQIINASKIALGQQTSYVGLATQQETIARNEMGMSSYTDGFMQFFADELQYILNKAKVMYIDNEGAEEAELLLSKEGLEFFKNSSEFQIEDMMVRVDIEDIIDDAARTRLLDIALAMAQNSQHTGFDMEDYLVVETSRTYTEMRKAFKKIIAKKKIEGQQAQQQQFMMQQAETEKQQAFQKEQQAMSESGKDNREMVKAEKDLAVEGMKVGMAAAKQ